MKPRGSLLFTQWPFQFFFAEDNKLLPSFETHHIYYVYRYSGAAIEWAITTSLIWANMSTAQPQLVAKLSPAQSNSNSVGWSEIALISTFTHPPPHPQGKYRAQLSTAQSNSVGWANRSRISLKPAWAELGTAQSQLVWFLDQRHFRNWGNFDRGIEMSTKKGFFLFYLCKQDLIFGVKLQLK